LWIVGRRKIVKKVPFKTIFMRFILELQYATYREVTVERSFTGMTADHYTFDPAKPSLDLICASGPLASFGLHGIKYAFKNSFTAH
jgi:hypothetical protein